MLRFTRNAATIKSADYNVPRLTAARARIADRGRIARQPKERRQKRSHEQHGEPFVFADRK